MWSVRWSPIYRHRFRRPFTSRADAAAVQRDELGWVHPDNKIDVVRVIDAAERAAQRWSHATTDFLTPSVHADCCQALKSMASSDIGYISFGGYVNAERSRMIVGRKESLPWLGLELTQDDEDSTAAIYSMERKEEEEEEREGIVAAIEIKGNFMFDPVGAKPITHRRSITHRSLSLAAVTKP